MHPSSSNSNLNNIGSIYRCKYSMDLRHCQGKFLQFYKEEQKGTESVQWIICKHESGIDPFDQGCPNSIYSCHQPLTSRMPHATIPLAIATISSIHWLRNELWGLLRWGFTLVLNFNFLDYSRASGPVP